jgi:hypothetical protein
MALRKFLILRKLRSSCLEGRTALIQLIVNFLTASFARMKEEELTGLTCLVRTPRRAPFTDLSAQQGPEVVIQEPVLRVELAS